MMLIFPAFFGLQQLTEVAANYVDVGNEPRLSACFPVYVTWLC